MHAHTSSHTHTLYSRLPSKPGLHHLTKRGEERRGDGEKERERLVVRKSSSEYLSYQLLMTHREGSATFMRRKTHPLGPLYHPTNKMDPCS